MTKKFRWIPGNKRLRLNGGYWVESLVGRGGERRKDRNAWGKKKALLAAETASCKGKRSGAIIAKEKEIEEG